MIDEMNSPTFAKGKKLLKQRRNKMRKMLIIPILLLFIGNLYALTASPVGTEVSVEYTEPSTNNDGSPLIDLDHTTVYYDIGSGAVEANQVPASSPSGGATITTSITIPVSIDQEVDADVWATASDEVPNESLPSNTVVVPIDRLAPASPN